jgi:hypothetical protein
VEKLNKYFINSQDKRIKDIPGKPNYLELLATSLKNIQDIKQ